MPPSFNSVFSFFAETFFTFKAFSSFSGAPLLDASGFGFSVSCLIPKDIRSFSTSIETMTASISSDFLYFLTASSPLSLHEISERSQFRKGQSTVGTIPNGAIVEAEVPVTFSDQHNITIVMNESNFITISRATQAIQKSGFLGAKAIDANTIKIPLTDLNSSDLVRTIATIENILLETF